MKSPTHQLSLSVTIFLPHFKEDLDPYAEGYGGTKVISFTFRKDVYALNTIFGFSTSSGGFEVEKFAFNYFKQGAKDTKTRLGSLDDRVYWLDWNYESSLKQIQIALKKEQVDFKVFWITCIDLEGDWINKNPEVEDEDSDEEDFGMERKGFFLQPKNIKARAQQGKQLALKFFNAVV